MNLVTRKVCGLRKHPIGRDVGAAAGNSYCGYDCEGIRKIRILVTFGLEKKKIILATKRERN